MTTFNIIDNYTKDFVGEIVQNSLVKADCLDAMKHIADESIDLILCDLPYG
jgi:DNA modification methylase